MVEACFINIKIIEIVDPGQTLFQNLVPLAKQALDSISVVVNLPMHVPVVCK